LYDVKLIFLYKKLREREGIVEQKSATKEAQHAIWCCYEVCKVANQQPNWVLI